MSGIDSRLSEDYRRRTSGGSAEGLASRESHTTVFPPVETVLFFRTDRSDLPQDERSQPNP